MIISKRDIENRADLENMLGVFYKKVFKDDLISYFFIEVVPLNLETHIPVIADFWESVLLDGILYQPLFFLLLLRLLCLIVAKKQIHEKSRLLFLLMCLQTFLNPSIILWQILSQKKALN